MLALASSLVRQISPCGLHCEDCIARITVESHRADCLVGFHRKDCIVRSHRADFIVAWDRIVRIPSYGSILLHRTDSIVRILSCGFHRADSIVRIPSCGFYLADSIVQIPLCGFHRAGWIASHHPDCIVRMYPFQLFS